jgi:DMSO/TMAO reductase YedYZ molybdopterin-dependent catalytic subunit
VNRTRERMTPPGKLPPGQRRIEGFPRFGTHLARPAPVVAADPTINVRGAVAEAFDLPVTTLASLPRRELTADFHCVAGWTATGVRWEGVPFAGFYRAVIAPALPPGVEITHVVFRGLDGYESVVLLEDALADDVLLAERLDGRPLGAAHGAPVRLVSPAQYGYISTKHLCGIEVRSGEPTAARPASLIDYLTKSHPRARVWEEERHASLPGRLIRPFYRALRAPLLWLCARGETASR